VDAALLGGALLENGDDAGAAAEVVLLEDGEEVAQFGSIVERRHEIVFVDSGLEDHGALVDALRSAGPSDRELEVVLIDAERDGIAQITDVLSDHTDLDAVHIVSHGAEAAVQLGSSWLMADNLDAHSGSLLAWSDALSEDADLLFYGCNLAGGDEGAAFAESLAKLTGADVGASTDATGSALLGGDWNLELRLGDVESEIAIDAQLRQSWTGILDNAPPTHSVPGTQTTDVDTSLVFSDGAGNGIAIDDPDAGGNQVEVTLTATNGTLTLTGPGAVIDVNAETSWSQDSPRVASNGAGNSVVVWASDRQDGDGWGIYAQLYDASGNPVGSEFRVNGTTAGDQLSPDVSMNASGEFVVVWQSADGDGTGIFAQRYDASGTALGGELLVNTEELGDQTAPVVAMAADGSFAVAWQSQGQDGDASGIYAQRFDSSGAALGAELRVNSETADDQTQPAIAMDADGDFVVVWQSQLQDGAGGGIYAQRFDATGIAQGAEFRVNSEIANDQGAPDVAMDAAGNFVVAWESLNQDGSSWGIFAQRYDAAGTAQGAEFQVNTLTQNQQRAPSVSMDADGDFVVAWQGRPGSWDVFGQQFDAAGNPVGAEFQINQASGGNQTAPDVAMDADGDFKAVWTGKTPGDNDGIASRNFLFTKGISYSTGDGIGDASIVMRGTQGDLNDALDGLTFTPTAGFSGLASVVITTDDLGNTGVGGALSTNDTVYVIVGDVPNLAPILDASGDLRLSDVDEDAGDPSGDTVADILASAGGDPIFDIDPGALEGIAVVAVDDSHGTWQFSIDGGSTWTDFGAVGDASAALLDSAAHVRFVPAPDYAGPAGLLRVQRLQLRHRDRHTRRPTRQRRTRPGHQRRPEALRRRRGRRRSCRRHGRRHPRQRRRPHLRRRRRRTRGHRGRRRRRFPRHLAVLHRRRRHMDRLRRRRRRLRGAPRQRSTRPLRTRPGLRRSRRPAHLPRMGPDHRQQRTDRSRHHRTRRIQRLQRGDRDRHTRRPPRQRRTRPRRQRRPEALRRRRGRRRRCRRHGRRHPRQRRRPHLRRRRRRTPGHRRRRRRRFPRYLAVLHRRRRHVDRLRRRRRRLRGAPRQRRPRPLRTRPGLRRSRRPAHLPPPRTADPAPSARRPRPQPSTSGPSMTRPSTTFPAISSSKKAESSSSLRRAATRSRSTTRRRTSSG
jgi:hypothetical protein